MLLCSYPSSLRTANVKSALVFRQLACRNENTELRTGAVKIICSVMGAKNSKEGPAAPKITLKNRKNKKDNSTEGEEDSGVDVSGHAILSNPLILEAIFSHLQILHLLQASSVCKLWNSEVCKYLQKRRRCLIKLDLDRLINTDVERFKKFLQSTWTLPFQGLWISLSSAEVEYDNDFPIWEVFPSILEKLDGNFKSLGLRIHSSCSNPAGNNSRAETCMQEILRSTLPKLEFLRLEGDPSRIIKDYNAVGFKETDVLDKLQEFDFTASGRWDDLAWGFCKQVASASPNLQSLNGYVTPDWIRLPKFASLHERGLVKKFKFLTNSPEDSEIVKEFITSYNDIKYKKLIVSGLWRHASQTSRYVCRQLLMSSQEILEQLSMHNKDLILFATANAFPENGFPRLRRFKIKTRWEKSIDKFLSDGIDFNAHFPNLKYVEIKWRVSHALKSKKKQKEDEKVAEGDCDKSIIIPCKTVKILKVDFGYSYQYPQVLPKLAKHFPQVEHLYVHDGTQELRQYVAELGTIWTTTLETVSFTQVRDAQIKPLTGVFCGVGDAEAEGMQSHQNGSKGLAIQGPSPRLPCILDNLGLKILRFEIVHVGTQWKKLEKLRQKQPGMVMLGKFTGVLALSKNHGLTIELYLKGRHELVDPKHRFSLDHLKEHVTVKTFERGFNMDDVVY